MFEGATCGTAVRVGSDLFVTAAHVVSDKGRLLSCTIDGVPIKLEFSVPRMDIAVIRGELMPELFCKHHKRVAPALVKSAMFIWVAGFLLVRLCMLPSTSVCPTHIVCSTNWDCTSDSRKHVQAPQGQSCS